ncbi:MULTISPECIES: DUF3126 family protein [unclassified Xanthobacter]|uniref:DUF3126 family protein n=1 Tax=unclassified Xanthobacter TaxID=2623496 RepID=UPI001EDFC2C3|nr:MULTISPECIES: DUF3126 family protein [unclassified Xanthobacter]
MDKNDIESVQRYLRNKFGNPQIKVVARPKKKDSADVLLGDEDIGVIFEDKEDGDLCYHFQMTIFDIDLED